MATHRINNGLVEVVATPGVFTDDPVELVNVPATPTTVDDVTLDTAQAALTASDTLTDSTATNPTDTDFNQLACDLGTKLNAVIDALQAAGIIVASS
jgi:hypothetical protein